MEASLSEQYPIMADSSAYHRVDLASVHDSLPKIQYDMREHKAGIVVTWTILFISSAVSPIVLYFALRYGGNVSLATSE
jgi:hypothetical protein